MVTIDTVDGNEAFRFVLPWNSFQVALSTLYFHSRRRGPYSL